MSQPPIDSEKPAPMAAPFMAPIIGTSNWNKYIYKMDKCSFCDFVSQNLLKDVFQTQ